MGSFSITAEGDFGITQVSDTSMYSAIRRVARSQKSELFMGSTVMPGKIEGRR